MRVAVCDLSIYIYRERERERERESNKETVALKGRDQNREREKRLGRDSPGLVIISWDCMALFSCLPNKFATVVLL